MVAAVGIKATQAVALAAGAQPAQEARVTQVLALAAQDGHGDVIQATQGFALVAALGRASNPKVRPWYYKLDGHEMVVIRCGNIETLVADITTGEWSVFGSDDDDLWRAQAGVNWPGAGKLSASGGSDVVVGDDTVGTLYFLDPDGDIDDHPVDAGDNPRPFMRRVTTQLFIGGGYTSVPCFGVQVFGSVGGNDGDVQLEFSDDRGDTWNDAGSITLAEGDYTQRLNWTSLGAAEAPGRLFRLTDRAALKRIDGFYMDDDQEAQS